MSTTVTYKGNIIATVNNASATLETEGKYLEAKILLTDQTTPILQTKSVTPTESAQTITPDVGYDGLGEVDVAAISSTYVGTGVSRQAAQTIHPSSSDQSIAANKYLTGAQTIKGVTTTNLSADNIKKDVVVQVGDSADPDRVVSVTGTYEGGGGGSSTTFSGSFITGSTMGATEHFDIPYTGNGYITSLSIFIKGGYMKEPVYSMDAGEGILCATLIKCDPNAPTYDSPFSFANGATTFWLHKTGTNNHTSVTDVSTKVTLEVYSSSVALATGNVHRTTKIRSKNRVEYLVWREEGTTYYGWLPNTEYCYVATYSE